MSNAIIPLTIDLEDGSSLSPHWTLDVALESARQVEAAPGGRKVVRIRQGADIVLEGAELRRELDE